MPLNEVVVDTVSANNFKALGEAHAVQSYRQREAAIGHDQRMDKYAETHFASHSERVSSVDPSEAFASKQMFTGDVVAQQLAALLAALNSGQQGVKSAQTTPPVTP